MGYKKLTNKQEQKVKEIEATGRTVIFEKQVGEEGAVWIALQPYLQRGLLWPNGSLKLSGNFPPNFQIPDPTSNVVRPSYNPDRADP